MVSPVLYVLSAPALLEIATPLTAGADNPRRPFTLCAAAFVIALKVRLMSSPVLLFSRSLSSAFEAMLIPFASASPATTWYQYSNQVNGKPLRGGLPPGQEVPAHAFLVVVPIVRPNSDSLSLKLQSTPTLNHNLTLMVSPAAYVLSVPAELTIFRLSTRPWALSEVGAVVPNAASRPSAASAVLATGIARPSPLGVGRPQNGGGGGGFRGGGGGGGAGGGGGGGGFRRASVGHWGRLRFRVLSESLNLVHHTRSWF